MNSEMSLNFEYPSFNSKNSNIVRGIGEFTNLRFGMDFDDDSNLNNDKSGLPEFGGRVNRKQDMRFNPNKISKGKCIFNITSLHSMISE